MLLDPEPVTKRSKSDFCGGRRNDSIEEDSSSSLESFRSKAGTIRAIFFFEVEASIKLNCDTKWEWAPTEGMKSISMYMM